MIGSVCLPSPCLAHLSQGDIYVWTGFRYWDHPYGPMGTYLKKGHLGIFLGFWFVIAPSL
jgi:hypothetical protein